MRVFAERAQALWEDGRVERLAFAVCEAGAGRWLEVYTLPYTSSAMYH